MAVLAYLALRLRNPWPVDEDLRRDAITFMLATYWHFMAAIWIALYALFAFTQPAI
jgi:heme/copper-type cytochrome/quinol oxidase subunit 3